MMWGDIMKKKKQRERTTRIFIDSASQLIRNEGIEALTIRKVADIAAYNSATLYNYFDNLEHLKSLAALTFIEDYTNSLDECIKTCSNAYEINEVVWLNFYRHTFRRPKVFHSIFGKSVSKSHNSYINEFYTLYPELLNDVSEKVKGMLVEENLLDRTMYLLKECSKEGYFNEEDLEEIYELLFFIYQGMLNQILIGDVKFDEETFVKKAKIYNEKIFTAYKKTT